MDHHRHSSLSLLIPPTHEEKLDFINGVARESYIADYCQMTPFFLQTSCVLTAAILRYRLSGQLYWKYRKGMSYKDVQAAKYTTFEVTISTSEEEPDENHVFIVHNGILYQSMYKKSEWNQFELTSEHHSILSKGTIGHNDGKQLIGFELSGEKMYLFFSVP